jgi:hypothetical protein
MLFLAFVLFIGIFMLAMAVHGADALTHGPGQSQSHHYASDSVHRRK